MSGKDYYLYMDGKKVKVSKEVFLECRHREDRERYFMEVLRRGRVNID